MDGFTEDFLDEVINVQWNTGPEFLVFGTSMGVIIDHNYDGSGGNGIPNKDIIHDPVIVYSPQPDIPFLDDQVLPPNPGQPNPFQLSPYSLVHFNWRNTIIPNLENVYNNKDGTWMNAFVGDTPTITAKPGISDPTMPQWTIYSPPPLQSNQFSGFTNINTGTIKDSKGRVVKTPISNRPFGHGTAAPIFCRGLTLDQDPQPYIFSRVLGIFWSVTLYSRAASLPAGTVPTGFYYTHGATIGATTVRFGGSYTFEDQPKKQKLKYVPYGWQTSFGPNSFGAVSSQFLILAKLAGSSK